MVVQGRCGGGGGGGALSWWPKELRGEAVMVL